MAVTALSGQDIIDLTNDRLAGYQNAVSDRAILSLVNEGKDEVWTILKNLQAEYFVQQTQSTDSTQITYFPKDLNGNPLATMSTNVRDYTLPLDLREIQFIEVTTPGYEQTIFVYKKITDEDFRTARRSANVDPTLTPTVEYFYTIEGKTRFVMAQFPETTFSLTIHYVRALSDFEPGDTIDEILVPYTKKIADYAAKKAMLGVQDPGQFSAWSAQWREDVVSIATGASDRNGADPIFVQDFLG